VRSGPGASPREFDQPGIGRRVGITIGNDARPIRLRRAAIAGQPGITGATVQVAAQMFQVAGEDRLILPQLTETLSEVFQIGMSPFLEGRRRSGDAQRQGRRGAAERDRNFGQTHQSPFHFCGDGRARRCAGRKNRR